MKVTFVSNYLNHHQIPFSDAMYKELNGKYRFIQTERMEEERINMGWKLDENKYPYLLKSYENISECLKYINESELVIVGGSSDELIRERIKEKKLIFRYNERIYKKGQWRAISPRGIYYMYKAYANAKKKNMYMLCASAYTACDLNIFRYYQNRMLKWGYFPKTYYEDIDSLLLKKKENTKLEIIWCGRFINWKHPELVVDLAEYLQENGKQNLVHITMIGVGELRLEYEKKIKDQNLEKMIDIIGPLTPNEVRDKMLCTRIFIATSDYNEGWGAVVNEAMNSACAVIASHAMGAVPYLIQHKINGLVYKSGKKKDFFQQVDYLIKNPNEIEKLGRKAYDTIVQVWNSDNAAKAVIEFAKGLLEEKKEKKCPEGPCSEAPVIKEWKMYQKLIKKQKI